MSKKGNAELYGVRFNLSVPKGQPNSQWILPPLAWINKDNDWYLVEFFTPRYLVNALPFLINRQPHRAWKVTSKEVLDNPVFRLNGYKTPTDKEKSNSIISGVSFRDLVPTIGIGVLSLFFSNNDHPSRLIAFTETFLAMLFFLSIACVIYKLSWKSIQKKEIYKIGDFESLDASINNIKEHNQEVTIEVVKSNAYTIKEFLRKLLFFMLSLATILICLFSGYGPSSNQLIFGGLLAAVFVIILLWGLFYRSMINMNNIYNSFKTNVGNIYSGEKQEGTN